jgi:hypothetical protein
MIYFQLFLVTLFAFFSSCNPEVMQLKHDPLNLLFEHHEKKQLVKYQMKLIAAGVPEVENDKDEEITQFALHYIVFKKMKLPQVRELIVSNVEEFLEMVNTDEQISCRLKNSLTYKNIKFNIGFGDNEGNFREPPYIAYAYLDEGIIYYCYEDLYFKEFCEEKNVEEPYEIAKELLKLKDTLPEKVPSD